MDSVTVETVSGKVEGRSADGLTTFLGIPYGASTAGPRRFKPPVAAPAWSGTKSAFEFGPRCPQIENPMPGALEEFGEPSGEASGEDCLVLNIWTPSTTGSHPVFVYLHGGGWMMGSGAAPAYNGANLAKRGDIVVVTLNHRFGIFGFMHLEELSGEQYRGSGNAGMLDIVLGLNWVRDNISAFGGDPSQITVGGQSGGGWKTSTVMSMPSAKGLFQRAIIMSGPMLTAAPSEEATRLARAMFDDLGVEQGDAASLEQFTPRRLIEAELTLPPPDVNSPYEFRPVVDGSTLPTTPYQGFLNGVMPEVPVLIGTTRYEHARSLHHITDNLKGLMTSDDEVRKWVTDLLGEHTDKMVDTYRRLDPDASPTDLYVILTSDLWARIPAIRIAEARLAHSSAPVFMYRFDWETPVYGGGLRSAHGLDVPFALHNTEISSLSRDVPGASALEDAMSDAWIAFVRSGDPNTDALPSWPRYSTEERATMILDDPSRLENDPAGDERLSWDGIPTDLLGGYQIPGVLTLS